MPPTVPYGQVTAIDLNRGEIAWQRPFGDGPELRANPALKGVSLPAVLGIGGPQGGVVTKGGLFFVGGEDLFLHAIDKSNGKDLWQGGAAGAIVRRSDDVPDASRKTVRPDRDRARNESGSGRFFEPTPAGGTEWLDSSEAVSCKLVRHL